jgi:hypothetical protein
MAGAIIKVKDAEDGTIDMDITFNPDVDNNSMAHRLVQRFVEYINAPEVKAAAEQGQQTETT